jgi:8-oxo-dGTP diphosphatase
MSNVLGTPFLGKVRVRVCGILIENKRILLVKHLGLGKNGSFWSPPGGGLEFGESIEDALKREFLEETGLEIRCGRFLRFHEHIDDRFHALELFFRVERISGTPVLGNDPEVQDRLPMMVALREFSAKELAEFSSEDYHSCIPEFFLEEGIKIPLPPSFPPF